MRVLSESSDHPDAIELHRRAMAIDPGIAIATVYRTLNLLQEREVSLNDIRSAVDRPDLKAPSKSIMTI